MKVSSSKYAYEFIYTYIYICTSCIYTFCKNSKWLSGTAEPAEELHTQTHAHTASRVHAQDAHSLIHTRIFVAFSALTGMCILCIIVASEHRLCALTALSLSNTSVAPEHLPQ